MFPFKEVCAGQRSKANAREDAVFKILSDCNKFQKIYITVEKPAAEVPEV